MLPTPDLYTQIEIKAKRLRDPSLRWKIECLLRGLKSQDVSLTCSQFGIHRATFYRWLCRLEKERFEPESLRPHSCRPLDHPRRLQGAVLDRIRWYRETFHYGSDKIAWHLEQEGHSISSHGVYNVLKREGLPFRKRRDQKPNRHTRRYELDRPGQGLQLDIKYVPFLIEGKKAYVFNVIDECSRWRFQRAYRTRGMDEACDFAQRLYAAAPFTMERIQTDNDTAFTDLFCRTPSADGGAHPFPLLLQSLKIRHKLIPPGIKELNGKVERSHKTDDQEFYWRLPLSISFDQFQVQLQRWTFEYNHYRPHGSLKMKTPTDKLEQFGIYDSAVSKGAWAEPKKPSHYDVIVEKLRDHRLKNNPKDLVHWRFKTAGPSQFKSNPNWLPDTPFAIKALSQIYGMTTPETYRKKS